MLSLSLIMVNRNLYSIFLVLEQFKVKIKLRLEACPAVRAFSYPPPPTRASGMSSKCCTAELHL